MERSYVAIDLHRRRSLILRQNERGEELGVVRINNDPVALAAVLAEAGPDPEVAIEATYGWYWAVDVLQAEGANVHLVNPQGLHWDNRRVKNDYKDCQGLAARLRLGELPEAWIAPPAVREHCQRCRLVRIVGRCAAGVPPGVVRSDRPDRHGVRPAGCQSSRTCSARGFDRPSAEERGSRPLVESR